MSPGSLRCRTHRKNYDDHSNCDDATYDSRGFPVQKFYSGENWQVVKQEEVGLGIVGQAISSGDD
jgi:hypothetical protein